MGQYNSSLTRVQPILDAVRSREGSDGEWLLQLWRLAASTKPGATSPPAAFGPLVSAKIYERPVPPTTAFLRWAVLNLERLEQPPNYGAKGQVSREKRAASFGEDQTARQGTVTEALKEIDRVGGQGSARAWWAFEGFTHVDACFETETCLLFIEGKRTEAVSPSTRWFAGRNQLWRNVEVAQELAAGREFGVIVGVETAAAGMLARQEAAQSRDDSYPHLSAEQRVYLDSHLLGYVMWPQIVSAFGLSPSVLINRVGSATPPNLDPSQER